MATVIDCGNDRYVAGDPVAELAAGRHWCIACCGSGLDRGWGDELEICQRCGGRGDEACPGLGCCESDFQRRERSRVRLAALRDLVHAAAFRAAAREDYGEGRRQLERSCAIADAMRDLFLEQNS
ncbi:hypothetical protein Leucomu_06585 [Leucobacter muris]|uniref:Uncharacterized protein n=1 Tax=Leucobacter muris TaxID=1935379 RepID=A0ABX5QEX2_9MICO|nr:hypothetical protein [Leucobacter muris]QAB17633.1 hypothetical protein Leucomu_06585 [Leucobacter muris]